MSETKTAKLSTLSKDDYNEVKRVQEAANVAAAKAEELKDAEARVAKYTKQVSDANLLAGALAHVITNVDGNTYKYLVERLLESVLREGKNISSYGYLREAEQDVARFKGTTPTESWV